MGVQEDLTALAGKQPGDLIQSAHWNALVAAVKLVEQSLRTDLAALSASTDARFADASDRLDGLDGRVDGVEGRVGALEPVVQEVKDSLAALRRQFRRVTLATGRARYALGELAELTARVTDLDGNALDLSNAAARPWVDFVTVWGQLRAAPGFSTVGGAGERTVSVQVNAQGEARVLLRAEQTLELAEDVELQMATFLTTKVGTQERTFAAAVLDANTPDDAGAKEAFKVMTFAYDRADGGAVRKYADAYHVGTAGAILGTIPPLIQNWRDYRSTVVALVKADNDPVTADPNLGACSLQVTFRDWIGPWVVGEYLPSFEVHVPAYRDRFNGRISADYREVIEGLKDEVTEIVRDKGIWGRQRDFLALGSALDRLDRPNPPDFLGAAARQVQGALRVQQALEAGKGAVAAGGGEAAFVAFADASARADTTTTAAKQELTALVEQKMGEIRSQVTAQVQQSQQTFRDDLLAESGPIKAVERQVGAMTGTVAALKALNVADVASGITVIKGMDNRLKNLELSR